MFIRPFLLAAGLAILPLAVHPEAGAGFPLTVAAARAQLMGNDAWNYPRNSRGFAAQVQIMKKTSSSSSSGSGDGSGDGGYVVVQNNTTIGNLTEITQILDQGANGYIGLNANQSMNGNQTSTATNSTTVTDQIDNSQTTSTTTTTQVNLGTGN